MTQYYYQSFSYNGNIIIILTSKKYVKLFFSFLNNTFLFCLFAFCGKAIVVPFHVFPYLALRIFFKINFRNSDFPSFFTSPKSIFKILEKHKIWHPTKHWLLPNALIHTHIGPAPFANKLKILFCHRYKQNYVLYESNW